MSNGSILQSFLPIRKLQKQYEIVRDFWETIPQKYPDLQTIRSIDELTAEIPDPETIPSAENTEALIQAAEKTKNLCRETAEIITKIIQIFDRLGGI